MRGLSTRTAVRVTGVFGDFDGFLHACTTAEAAACSVVCGTENVLKLGKETVFEVVDDPAVDVVESTSSATADVCVYSST